MIYPLTVNLTLALQIRKDRRKRKSQRKIDPLDTQWVYVQWFVKGYPDMQKIVGVPPVMSMVGGVTVEIIAAWKRRVKVKIPSPVEILFARKVDASSYM